MNVNKLRALLQALTEGPVSLWSFKWQIGASQNEINYLLEHKWVTKGQTKTSIWIGITPQGRTRLSQINDLNLSDLILQEVA